MEPEKEPTEYPKKNVFALIIAISLTICVVAATVRVIRWAFGW